MFRTYQKNDFRLILLVLIFLVFPVLGVFGGYFPVLDHSFDWTVYHSLSPDGINLKKLIVSWIPFLVVLHSSLHYLYDPDRSRGA